MWSRTKDRQRYFRIFQAPGLLFGPLVLLLGLLILQPGCAGYRLAADHASVLGDGSKTLKVKGVDYPTLHPWLPHDIRSALRDELGARHLARWVDSGSADYEIQINVLSFTDRSWMRSELDTTILFDAALTIEGIIYDGSSNRVLWRSGPIVYTDRTEQSSARVVSKDLIIQTVRILADKMRNTF